MRTISREQYIQASQLFDWAIPEHYTVWFTGDMSRHKRTEVMMPRLTDDGQLMAVRYGNRLVYICPRLRRKGMETIPHGLGSTTGLVRFWRSDMTGTIVPERKFRGLKSIPEWGILYEERKSLLLYEFCTKDNFYRRLKSKIRAYDTNLSGIEEHFHAKAVVVFVCQVTRDAVVRYIERNSPTGEPYFFTDYASFTSVPIGSQLTSPIYLWEDGNSYPIRHA